MTRAGNDRFKKEVRARMAADGVAYNVARRRILAERETAEQQHRGDLPQDLGGYAAPIEFTTDEQGAPVPQWPTNG